MKQQILLFSLFAILYAFVSLHILAQNNRLTNENGQLLWQYSQNITEEKNRPNTFLVTFVFINGMNQTAISLRQELFYSNIEWLETTGIKVEKEEFVDFLTINLAPNQSLVWKYLLIAKLSDKEHIIEKSAVLIMNEDYEIRKEIIPEKRREKKPLKK